MEITNIVKTDNSSNSTNCTDQIFFLVSFESLLCQD